MIKVKQLAHVCIFAHDLDATRSFYRDVLGLDTQFNFLRDGKIFGFYLNCGGRSHVEVFQKDGTWWMFTSVAEPPYSGHQMLLLSAPALEGPYDFHWQTPVSSDVRFARCGGRIIQNETGKVLTLLHSRTFFMFYSVNM
jgi:catechol 2,3-dioxygenase-like lactoylglutathione lyase family enzyme